MQVQSLCWEDSLLPGELGVAQEGWQGRASREEREHTGLSCPLLLCDADRAASKPVPTRVKWN